MAITEEQDGNAESAGERGTSPGAPGSAPAAGSAPAGSAAGSSSSSSAPPPPSSSLRAGLDLESKIPPEFLVSFHLLSFVCGKECAGSEFLPFPLFCA